MHESAQHPRAIDTGLTVSIAHSGRRPRISIWLNFSTATCASSCDPYSRNPSPVVRSTSDRRGRPASRPKSLRSCARNQAFSFASKAWLLLDPAYLPRNVRSNSLQQNLDTRTPPRRTSEPTTRRSSISTRRSPRVHPLPRSSLLGKLDHDRLTQQLGSIKLGDSFLGVTGVFEFDEAKAGHKSAFADLEVPEELSREKG